LTFVQNAGIVAEYNPFHGGHALLFRRLRERLGPDCGVICAMSGNFVQRGEFALLGKYARAEAAVRCGADLVLELPLPWALSSAEGFARGGVGVLAATGVVTHLAFGSECGDARALAAAGRCVDDPAFIPLLRQELARGDSFPAARQRAAEALSSPEAAAPLGRPNDLLGVEYCRALAALGAKIRPLAFRREGAGHDAPETEGALPSASALRRLIRMGEEERALALLPGPMAALYRRERDAGRAPVWTERCERAILARLRSMERADYAALDEGREGLGNRLYTASRNSSDLESLFVAAKTRRYPMARLRRMVMWAYLGLRPEDRPKAPPYLRPLAANERGRALLAQIKRQGAAPLLTKPADVRALGEEARRLFDLEVRAGDLYALAYPSLSAAQAGSEWRAGPVML
jgi:predicted nucleotidyltransferase